ncbi:hypothetical protein IV203_001777 [Nitzschia inconspicua]|uniref:Uncharacterized protein n=1 Tax=Nitzschia inconspicua TaxID=303405 RepID=A0A9K3PTX8_9STRA|nr:hypothetical protein IV203_001777 [Nitzschia inconspicua]
MPPSSPIQCKDATAFHIDNASRESVDWTNATEATSFSGHDDVVVPTAVNSRFFTLTDNRRFDRKVATSKITVQAMVLRDDDNQEEMNALDDSSSRAGVDSTKSSSSFTCDTSECAMKVLQRDSLDDDDQSWNDVPLLITLINDNVHNTDRGDITTDTSINDNPETGMSPLTLVSSKRQHSTNKPLTNYEITLRLERAEAMLESYRNTVRSNEHLIESLEQTLMETRESAQDLWVERNRLEKELEETLDEQDALILTEKNCLVRRIHTGVLALSLLYFMVGGSEHVLIFVATVYLLEDVMTLCL